MLHLRVSTLPHNGQRYDTVGDYQELPSDFGRGPLCTMVTVSDLGSWQMEFLVALHELVEWALTKQRGIPASQIDDFDKHWEPPYSGVKEPGDDLTAPYYPEHQFATGIERLMAAELGVNWIEYERRIEALEYQPQQQGNDHDARTDQPQGEPGQRPADD